ncbi:MAG: bifunctional riboflavin kinase/FAD synthetase [Hyphomicrobiaceae bacterium]
MVEHMRVVRDFQPVTAMHRGHVVAVGNFDGVHRGHQALLRRALDIAKVRRTGAGVLVFEPHPRVFFRPEESHFELTPLPRKLELLSGYGMQLAGVLSFNAALANQSPEAFVEHALIDWLGVSHVVVGYDFFFGKSRSGTPELLKSLGLIRGFGVDVVAPQAEAGEPFSSSAIRAKLAASDVSGAAHDLGSWWRVTGPVVGGAQRGGPMGFPTANVVMPKGTSLGHGIFAVRVAVDGGWHSGAAYLGTRPTFDDGKPVLEVFVFDFAANLYGKSLTVEFIDHIRPDRKFDNVDALVAQMEQDCARARAILAEAPALPNFTR